jgi:hypothetical protein
VQSVDDLKQENVTQIRIQKDTSIDLTSSGSILVAGKTRSGKTTGIIEILLNVLLHGRDSHQSEVIIIDPKCAELSRLPHTVSLDENGNAQPILNALKKFTETIKNRQKVLNDLCEQTGNVLKWWEIGMHPSFLFIDEYVSARAILPSRASKDNPEYCLSTFDNYVKRIVTMAASAGCFCIISIAQASVSEGGLPSMLREAMSTKILFRPTLEEARLLWDSNSIQTLPQRQYQAGDCFWSSTDGIHDYVSFAQFPNLDFDVYRQLGLLLSLYYSD